MKSIDVPLRLIAVLGACTALAGCLSSGGVGGAGGTGTGGTGTGGTTTGGLTVTEHDAAVKRVTSLIPSSNVPTSGTASYAGGVKTDLYKGTSPIGTLLGDLAMTIDFSKSGATQGITGEITNIRGKQGTTDVTYAGKLTTEDAKSKGFSNTVGTVTTTVPAPVVGSVTTTTGSVMAHFTGDLTVDGKSGDVVVQTGGSFFGDQGQAIYGPTGGTWWGPAGPTEYSVRGTWFAEKK